MHPFPCWATEDFDLFEFIGHDDQNQGFSGSSQNGDYYADNQVDPNAKDEKDDYMYSIMQYNDMAVSNDNNMQYGNMGDMSGNGFIQDDRFQPIPGSALNNTITKLHLQQQQGQNQPSTSRLSNIVNNQPNYAGRMRPQISTQLGQQPQMNASDLADNVLLPTSSTSPQNNGYLSLPQQTAVKAEPMGYEMNGSEYFDSTSDAESHYSHGMQSSSAKPRKYRIKPESEKVNPQYRVKRAKNNDAVRRSREKAKQQQVEKEKRLHFLEAEHNTHYKMVNALKQKIRELETENANLRKNCQCGAAQQLFRH